MMCAVCGGNIRPSSSCNGCGISYDEMIDTIRHDEMIRLLEKIKRLTSSHEPVDLEVSLLACEIANSHFLVPAEVVGDTLQVSGIKSPDGKQFIMLFTDREEYDKCDFDKIPATNPFKLCMDLLEDEDDGFVINVKGDAWVLPKDYLETFFGDQE